MDLALSIDGATTRFALSGDIDESGAVLLKEQFSRLDLEQTKHVVLDFEHVRYIGSSGIGKLLLLYKRLGAHGGKLELVRTPVNIRTLFIELNLDSLFSIQ